MMARAKKNTPQPRSVWEDSTVVANPDSPAVRKEISSLRWKRRALNFVAFGAVPAMFIMGAGMMAQATSASDVDDTTASVIVNGSKGKSEAFASLQAWISSTPSPLPGGSIVSWDGYTTEKAPAPTSDAEIVPRYVFESHTFTVARGEAMWRATVQVAVDDVIGASATGAPSLTPLVDVDISPREPWFTLRPTTASPQVKQAIDAWAAAYTGGDPDALHQIVQDRNTDRSYIPLYGVQQLVGTETVAAGARELEAGGIATDTIVVRVQLFFWWVDGKPVIGENDQEPTPTPVAYDVLVEHADTATPVVVAWGAPGSGPELTAYQNAVGAVLAPPERGVEAELPADAGDEPSDEAAADEEVEG